MCLNQIVYLHISNDFPWFLGNIDVDSQGLECLLCIAGRLLNNVLLHGWCGQGKGDFVQPCNNYYDGYTDHWTSSQSNEHVT